MHEEKLRAFVGLFLVGSQFLILLLVIALYLVPKQRGFEYVEMTTTVGILMPAFAAYTVPIVKYIVNNRYKRAKGKLVGGQFVTLALVLPALFAFCVGGSVLAKAFGWGFPDFEQFKIFVGIIQSAFAVYVGLFISSLFDAPNIHSDPMSQEEL